MNEKTSATVHHLPLPSSRPANPFRPGSKKAVGFEIFLRGGTRDDLLGDLVKLGVAGTTARTWLSMFRAIERSFRAPGKGGTE